MPKLLATSLLIALVKIYIARAIELSICGLLPQYKEQNQTIETRMTYSNPTSHHWPWHAAIFHSQSDSNAAYQCGGTLISANWILTAAHCVFRNGVTLEPQEISLSLGRIDLAADETESEQYFNVTKVVPHQNYSSTYVENDIALVRLSHPATFNDFVRPICLWKSNETEFHRVTGRYGTVIGWGKTEAYKYSNVLQEAHLNVVSHTRCLVSNRDYFGICLTETNYCAGLRNGTSVCNGDSGGSMSFKEDGLYYIRGIVSASPSRVNHTTQKLDCDTMQYAIYTDVAMFLQWIRDTTETTADNRKETTTETTEEATTETTTVSTIGTECRTEVQCARDWDQQECKIDVHPTNEMCEIIFDESSYSTIITSLRIGGEFESIPYLSDAITKFENLEILHMQNIKLKIVDGGRLTAFGRIQELDLSRNQIAHLDANAIGDLKELRYLSLNTNTIKELHADMFKELHNLKELYLNDNQMQDLPQGLFNSNRRLQIINLSGNRLNELHQDTFTGLRRLTKVSLDGNKFQILPQFLFRDNQLLQEIGLSTNFLEELHADIFQLLRNLLNLYLFDNKLQSLPEGLFRDSQQLRIINLGGNQLKELPVDIFKELYNLEELSLFDNELEILPQGLFRDNRNLTLLSLHSNRIKKIESDLSHLSNQTLIEIRENVCIDDTYDSYDLTSSEIINKIRTKCSN